MRIELLKEYIDCGREIEFKFNDKMFSITYSPSDMEDFISFCEFFKKPFNVKTFHELLKVSYNGTSVAEMWESLSEDDIWLF